MTISAMRITAAAAEFLAIFHLSLHPRDCSALLIRSRALGPKSVWRPLMSYAGSTVATPTAAIDKENYWDKHHPEVPRKFLDSIRTEPWRGIFEPCSNHPLTEVQVEGKVPRGLEGTLFRNGEEYGYCDLLVLKASSVRYLPVFVFVKVVTS